MRAFGLKYSTSFIDYFLVFFVFDLLFMPYLAASTPMSFFILILMSFSLFSNVKKNVLVTYFLIIVIMLSSALNGLTLYSTGSVDNLKRVVQMSLVLSLIFLNFEKVNLYFVTNRIVTILVIFVFYMLTLLIISLFSPELYIQFLNIFSPNDIEIIYLNVEMYRFSYVFSDPNSFGYLCVFIITFLFFYGRSSFILLTVYIIIAFLVLSTQSRGALLAFVAVTSIFLISKIRFSLRTFYFMIFLFTLFFVLFQVFQDYLLFIQESFKKRSEIEEAMGTGMGGGRDKKYAYLLENFNFNVVGTGYTLFINGLEFRPHSDFIRMILSYGFLFPIIFSSFFYSLRFKNVLLCFSFLFPFLLNSVVDDYRLFTIFTIFFLLFKYDDKIENSTIRSVA